MSFAVPGPFMACVQVALVLDQQFRCGKLSLELMANQLQPIPAHGSTFLNGFTVTLA